MGSAVAAMRPPNGTARAPRARLSRSHLLLLIAILVAIAAFVVAVVLAAMLAFAWFAFVGPAAG
jgi:hypothetical protein